MDWVNVTAQFENAVDTVEAHDYLRAPRLSRSCTSPRSRPASAARRSRRRSWDPVRYGLPGTTAAPPPGDAYALDMFAQIAQALIDPTGIDPMGGLDVQRIVAAGQSQSAGKLDDYLQQWQGGSAST
jgi:hypothetical protein